MTKKQTKEKYWIKKLVGLSIILDDQSIADILLAWSGFKPAALVELSYLLKSKISRLKFHKAIRDLEKILHELNLQYQLQLNYLKKLKTLTKYSYVAKNQDTLKKLIAADMEKNIKKRRQQLGILLGYPKTAVETFSKNKAFDRHKLPTTILKLKEIKFLNFRLSQYWQEELKYIKKRSQEIKKISPELYRRVMNKSR